jgi:hypothetical protein
VSEAKRLADQASSSVPIPAPYPLPSGHNESITGDWLID